MRPLPILTCLLLFIHAPRPTAGATITENCKRFGAIIISGLEFQDESPEDVVAFLNLNWKNSDPPVSGMDVELAPGAFAGRLITITAKDIKFSDLVGQVAEQLHAEVVIQTEGILLRPAEAKKAAP